jgi:hypothetical protein
MPVTRDPRLGRLPDQKPDRAPTMRAATTMERIGGALDETFGPAMAALTKLAGLDTPEGQLQATFPNPAGALAVPAITLAKRASQSELLERLLPRNAAGEALDYRQFPRIIDAVSDIIDRYPRVASHLDSISATLDEAGGEFGKFISPNQVTKQIRTMGAPAFKETGQRVGKLEINPAMETMGGRGAPADTLAHEFAHAGQFIADPRRFQGTYDAAGDITEGAMSSLAKLISGGNAGYHQNPAEVAARAVGRRSMDRTAGRAPIPYRDAVQREGAGYSTPDGLKATWQAARGKLEEWAGKRGVPLAPR